MSDVVVKVGSQTVVVGGGGGPIVKVSPASTQVAVSPVDDHILIDSPCAPGTVGVGIPGPAGPPGPPGAAGTPDLSAATTDDLAEGSTNLYYTDPRAELVALAASAAAVSLHVADPDPHNQYIDNDDVIDGGNF